MEKTTIYLSDRLQRELREAARRERRPQAEIVRDALQAYLRDRPRPRSDSIGMLDDHELRAEEAKEWVREQWSRSDSTG